MKRFKDIFQQEDKLLHLLAGAIIGAWSATLFFRWPVLAILPLVFAAFGKEALDKRRGGKFDWWDIVATVMGGVAAIIPAIIFYK